MTPWYDDVIAINDFQEVKELNENKPGKSQINSRTKRTILNQGTESNQGTEQNKEPN